MHFRPQFSLRTLLIFVTLVAVMLSVLWSWPRTHRLSYCPNGNCLGYYRGFSLHKGGGLFGRTFYKLTFPCTDPEDGLTTVEYSGPGWNVFHGFYPDGTLCEEGECWVDINGTFGDPCPDIHTVRNGKYYDTSGILVSEIKDGTGIQTRFLPDGTKVWELELKDTKRVNLKMWHPNGQLLTEKHYDNDRTHGPFVSYYPSGKKKTEGVRDHAKRVGRWTRYAPDGAIESITDYGDGTSPPKKLPIPKPAGEQD